jgi:hypothetical protein
MSGQNSYQQGWREHRVSREENIALVIAVVVLVVVSLGAYIAVRRLHIRPYQLVEAGLYLLCLLTALFLTARHLWTRRKRREETWPHPPLFVPMLKDQAYVQRALGKNAILLGYDVHSEPLDWTDETRRMQTMVLGQNGSGKTTLLLNIITQDVRRVVGSAEDPHRIPMIIFDGKGDQEFLNDVVHEIATAGRMHQLRILDPSRPDISVRYNPLYIKDDESYQEHVNFIFESFMLRHDFFKGHQATYFSDLVRVLVHTGKRFNIYDVLVMALDPHVMKAQIEKAKLRMERVPGISEQQRLNLQMSARNLLESLDDRDRVPKIQGLINELMTFLEDELSIITGPYDDLLTLDQVIDQELILFVSLNTNQNSRAVTALGRMLLQNLQLMVGRRYASPERNQQMVSVILDEFAAFAYSHFAQILQTARGSNIAVLFSLQSVPQLETVSPGFKDNVASAPNTVMLLRTRDEETARYFENASSRMPTKRLTTTVQRRGIFDRRYEEIGFASETQIKETRVQDEHIKNQPVGQMELLMTDNRVGTIHKHLHVRRPPRYRLPGFQPMIFPRVEAPLSCNEGANLRFKDPELARRKRRVSGQE